MNKLYDIIGKKIGRLRVLERVPNKNGRKSRWLCQCDCGTIKEVDGVLLTRGITLSCGCLRKEGRLNISCWKGFEEISGKYWSKVEKEAIVRGREFFISMEYAWSQYIKQNRKCALTGDDICFVRNYHKQILQTASIDRIDSSKGYIEGNIQWVHKDINKLKSNFEENELIEWCELVVNFKENT